MGHTYVGHLYTPHKYCICILLTCQNFTGMVLCEVEMVYLNLLLPYMRMNNYLRNMFINKKIKLHFAGMYSKNWCLF